jgi:hypothetical protein
MKRQFEDLKKNLVREQNASYAQALIQLADLRQSLLDLEGALMNALVAFPKAQASGSEEERAALERMDLAIRRATMGQIRLPNQLIWAVQKIVSPGDRLSPLSHEKAIKLQETLEAYSKAMPIP